jgi:hypothetical protein
MIASVDSALHPDDGQGKIITSVVSDTELRELLKQGVEVEEIHEVLEYNQKTCLGSITLFVLSIEPFFLKNFEKKKIKK